MARPPVAIEAVLARAAVVARQVGAVGMRVTRVSVGGALVDVCKHASSLALRQHNTQLKSNRGCDDVISMYRVPRHARSLSCSIQPALHKQS